SSRRRHTSSKRDWSSDVCSSDLDLDVVGCAQNGGSPLAQLDQQVDAQRHIGAFEHGHAAGQLDDLEVQFVRHTGGAQDDGGLVGLAVGEDLLHRRGGAEVDDDVAPAGQAVRAGIDGDPVLFAGVQVDAGDHLAVVPLGDHIA